jgi:type IV pilus assembly protein PilM
MASGAVWGIDIGQCALKALRCRPHEDGSKVVAEAFDYIEYPKILSQPGSDPAELVGDALKQFLSRNSVIGDRVAISVSGQAGLARFIKLPPVEAKKIPDIVRYEARQQIPFDLNDVIWDYQRMGVSSDEEGFALETEVGLFAMKRDAVFRALDPFLKADIEVDIVQLTPLVLYNFLFFDQLGPLPSAEEYDPENPPESTVIISLGTDATDLVISNGFRVWQRSIPLGGSHFTKALTKELKLTFAKAEHLKRNATSGGVGTDAKAVFQAMRPVFSDLLTELQRSISYFSNLDRSAKIGRVMALGNAIKLPGLRRYLSQSLGFEIEKIESFPTLTGSQVVSAPVFQENLMAFPVAYGLALQGLSKGSVHTNLLPREIIYDRLVKRKKPWAVAAAAMILLGCSIGYAAYSLAMNTVEQSRWKAAESDADRLSKDAADFKSKTEQATTEYQTTDKIGRNLVGNVEGRLRWLELLRAINACLPVDDAAKTDTPDDEEEKSEKALAAKIAKRRDLHITNVDSQQLEDVSQWYAAVKPWDSTEPPKDATAAGATPGGAQAPGAPSGPTGGMGGASSDPNAGANAGPTGPGWVIQLTGYHYHNADKIDYGAQYVRKTLIEKLRKGKVKLPSPDGKDEMVTLADFGISYPVLVNPPRVETVEIPNPNALPDSSADRARPGETRSNNTDDNKSKVPTSIRVQRFSFTVQFCWQPRNAAERDAVKKTREAKEKEAAAAAAAATKEQNDGAQGPK